MLLLVLDCGVCLLLFLALVDFLWWLYVVCCRFMVRWGVCLRTLLLRMSLVGWYVDACVWFCLLYGRDCLVCDCGLGLLFWGCWLLIAVVGCYVNACWLGCLFSCMCFDGALWDFSGVVALELCGCRGCLISVCLLWCDLFGVAIGDLLVVWFRLLCGLVSGVLVCRWLVGCGYVGLVLCL